ncbi:MAG: putative GMC-type oxidoreductase [Syntrophomonadaceae bacterium]|nr:putative GMC-type oxidoreductase [Bacillota bacterium]
MPLSPIEIKDFDKDVERILDKLPFLFRLSLLLLEISPLFFFIPPFRRGIPLPFTRLSLEERTDYLRKLFNSRLYPLRAFSILLKFPTLLAFDGRNEIREVIGYYSDCTTGTEKTPVPETVESRIIEQEKPLSDIYEINCDVLVVGSGAGGAVVAKELSGAGLDVAVVEEGFRYDTTQLSGKPADGLSLYRNFGATIALGPLTFPPQPSILLPLGRCLGGTTVINSTTCFRVPDFVLGDWTRAGLEDMSPEDMRPYFEQAEKSLSVHPLSLNLMGGAHEKIMEGAKVLGYENHPLNKNTLKCRACGTCQYGCSINAKQSMDVTYIPLAIQAGATFYTGFKAEKIAIKTKKVDRISGTVFKRDIPAKPIGKFTVKAKVFVIAAGAVQTPFLLLSNRIANSSGMVGKNLRIHPSTGSLAIFPERLYGARGTSQAYAITEFSEEGIIIESTMVPPAPGTLASPLVGKELSQLIGDWNKVAMVGVMISDTDADGRIKKLPFFDQPVVIYRITERVKNEIVRGLAEAAKIALAAGAEKVLSGIVTIPWVKDYKDIEKIITSKIRANEIAWGAYHPQGTCRMSENSKKGVVDSYGKAHDVENLFIADGSIFPTCIGVNPQITIMAFALRCAEYISRLRTFNSTPDYTN